jgi:YesN/AraC family two-component response regulator
MKADECRTDEEVHAAHTEMIEEYSRRMRLVRNSNIYSKQILRVLDYISEHLHSRIMINEAAKHLNISSAYLSRLFKAETGMAFSDYVNRKKIEEASSLLRFSEYTDLEISTLLCFSSQSYFIKIFKKYMGMTPREYKKRYRLPDFVTDGEPEEVQE